MTDQTVAPASGKHTKLPHVTAAVDVFESDDHYLVRADVPGVNKDSVDISFHEGALSFKATRGSDVVYSRTLGFGDDVDPDGIGAKLEHGVLELQLSKSAAKKPRKIAIEA